MSGSPVPRDTAAVPPAANWGTRVLGFGVTGLLTFLKPPLTSSGLPSRSGLAAQAVAYGLLGLALLGWAVLDLHPAAALHRARGVPLILGLLAVIAGFACALGGGGTFMVAIAALAALYAAFETGPAGALAVTAASILAIEVTGLVFGASYSSLLGLPVIVFIGLVLGRNRASYQVQAEQASALLAQREQLQAEQRRNDLLDERARIAREIHDVLAHSLGALGIQIQAARAALSDLGDPDRAGELLVGAQRMAGEGLVETRRAIHALRVDILPLNEELARVSHTYAQRYHASISFDTNGASGPLPPDATVALLRVAQEALVNAAKHAPGQHVEVSLDYSPADVRLTIRNDLTDPAPDPGVDRRPRVSTADGGYGLTGMRERLRLLDGTLEAGRGGSQWIVVAELPRARPDSGAS
jgi:signal transduction histidine kinase